MPEPRLRFSVMTPDAVLVHRDDVRKVRLRLADGQWLSIFPQHAPLLAETLPGSLQYVAGGQEHAQEHVQELGAGIVHVAGGEVVVLTTGRAEAPEVDLPEVSDAALARLVRASQIDED